MHVLHEYVRSCIESAHKISLVIFQTEMIIGMVRMMGKLSHALDHQLAFVSDAEMRRNLVNGFAAQAHCAPQVCVTAATI